MTKYIELIIVNYLLDIANRRPSPVELPGSGVSISTFKGGGLDPKLFPKLIKKTVLRILWSLCSK